MMVYETLQENTRVTGDKKKMKKLTKESSGYDTGTSDERQCHGRCTDG